MKKYALLSAIALAGLHISAQEIIVPDSTGFKFTDKNVVKQTSVKDQNKTGTCWCFSTNSFLENEILKKTGKEVDLSEMFVVYHCYADKAMKHIRMDQKINFEQGGSTLDVPYVWKKYGMVPEEVYSGLNYGDKKHNHYELIAGLKGYLNGIARMPNRQLSTAWYNGFIGILDAYFGKLPEKFSHDGKEYTPETYAASLGINIDDYIPFTSFTHHPFNEKFALEVADNWLWGEYYNVKMEEMKQIVDNAIKNGYSVAWAADVSERGFQWKKGFAVLPVEKSAETLEGTELARWTKLSDKDRENEQNKIKGPVEEIKVTQELRQEWFDAHKTTDDHGMVIVGDAVDQEGNRYYKVKNSWDTNQLYDGYIYVSEAYFLAKTMDIVVNKAAVPAEIAKNCKL